MTFKYDPSKICQKLRCKEMLIHVDKPERAEDSIGSNEEGLFDHYDAVAYWCECTQTGRGPDGERVHMNCCSQGTRRECFIDINSIT